MNSTSPPIEATVRLRRALAALPPGDHYAMLGVRFSLVTDDRDVREFFRATYRHFACPGSTGGEPMLLAAVLSPGLGGPFAAVGERAIDLGGRAMPVNRAFLFLLNGLMDHVSDFLLIHGAAVSVGSRGLIIAGAPTAGKSTLVLELARRGATFLSDDVAPLERSTGRLHPFPRAIGVRREGESLARLDRSALPPESVHGLAYKWLVDPAALGVRLPRPDEPPCEVAAVLLLDGLHDLDDPAEPAAARPPGHRAMEIALAEEDASVLAELRATAGVSALHPLAGRPFPVYGFEVTRAAGAMAALSELGRRHRDLVLYVDEAREARPAHGVEPALRQTRWSPLLLELARSLLNRSESGALMASCGGLPGLIAELGGLLKGARAYRLRPGSPEATADLVLGLLSGQRHAQEG
jgi:hypothetical protein